MAQIHTDYIRSFLLKWETRQTVGYIPCQRKNYLGHGAYDVALYGPVLGVSGVTIGTGVDLGQQTAGDLGRMGVPAAIVFSFLPYLGKRKMDAVFALHASPLTLSDADCDALDNAVHDDYTRRAAALFNAEAKIPFADCPKQAQAVIVSLFYHLGKGAAVYPATWKLLCNADWPAASHELQTSFRRYTVRRVDEGKLLAGVPAGAATAKA